MWRDTIEHVTKTINYLINRQLVIPTKHKDIVYKAKWDFAFTNFRIKLASVTGIVFSDVEVSIKINFS
jgi:hypothetical protein